MELEKLLWHKGFSQEVWAGTGARWGTQSSEQSSYQRTSQPSLATGMEMRAEPCLVGSRLLSTWMEPAFP